MVFCRQQNEIDWSLVREVSRSFFLTLRLLPRAIQSAITFAYLLARASDTIADSSTQGIPVRLQALQTLRCLAREEKNECNLATIKQILAQPQANPAERRLLEQLPGLLRKLEIHPDREEIQQVWSLILEGQIFDLTHSFAVPLSREQLDRYTFLVAGCVGRFWTDLCRKNIPRFASLSTQRMEELGIYYGKGLQLINILRDREEDALYGRIYVHQEDVSKYCAEALRAMQAGIDYAMAVKPAMLRYAALIPALIGIKTLKLIQLKSGKVKISRAEVRRTLIAAIPCLWNSRFIVNLSNTQKTTGEQLG